MLIGQLLLFSRIILMNINLIYIAIRSNKVDLNFRKLDKQKIIINN